MMLMKMAGNSIDLQQQLELDFPLFRVASIDWADAHGD